MKKVTKRCDRGSEIGKQAKRITSLKKIGMTSRGGVGMVWGSFRTTAGKRCYKGNEVKKFFNSFSQVMIAN